MAGSLVHPGWRRCQHWSDRLFPPAQSERIAAGIPGAGPVRTIHSDYGHDGFLIEEDQVGRFVSEFLAEGARRP